jgi:2,3-bisphosphoglycerate-dependent phosphoglycerate mutase
MDTRVYLLRHAETARPDVFHGYESDTDLGARGYRQAAAVAPVIAAYKPDGIVSSNMLRARKTAEPIARACNLSFRTEPDLHERKVGDMQGTPILGEFGVWPDTLARWTSGETSYAPAGMESFDDIATRVLPVWDRVSREFSGKSVVIVAHGIVVRVILLSVLAGYNVADWPRLGRIANVSITELTGSGRAWQAARIGFIPDEVRRVHEEPPSPPHRPARS